MSIETYPPSDRTPYALPLLISADDYEYIDFNDSLISTPQDYSHATRVCIYTRYPHPKGKLKQPADILMQSMFDGYIGFPGGHVEDHESIMTALNRELVEEVALDVDKYKIKLTDIMLTAISHKRKKVKFFFTKEVSPEDFHEIERNSVFADYRGTEVYGHLRVPLYIWGDGYQGLPVFLANQFDENSRDLLLYAIRKLELVDPDTLDQMLQKYKEYTQALKDTY